MFASETINQVPNENLDQRELGRYLTRIGDRWPIETALIGIKQSLLIEDGLTPDYLVVLISSSFDGVSWLERIRQAITLWDSHATGFKVDVHCYTPAEFERQRERLHELAELENITPPTPVSAIA